LAGSNKIRFIEFSKMQELLLLPKLPRDKLILRLLYETGCTVGELVDIKFSHFNAEKNQLRILSESARNGESRKVFVSKSLLDIITLFRKKNPDSPYLFYTRQSPKLTTKRVRQLVQKYSKVIGIKKTGPQILRYTHIVHAYQKNIPLDAIQKQVGLKRSRAIEVFMQLKDPVKQGGYEASVAMSYSDRVSITGF